MSIRACLLALGLALASRAAGAPPSETVLPASTQGFLSIADLAAMSAAWDETELGQLLAEPMMEAFNQEVERFVRRHWVEAHQRLGISWDDLKAVPRGELAIALAAPEKARPAFIVMMDVKGNLDGADALIAKITKTLTADGAKRRHAVHADTDITVFETPPPAGSPKGAKPKQTALFIKDETLVASDSLAVIQGIIDRWSGDKPDQSLGGLKPFQEAMTRAKPPADAPAPHARWYANPLGFAAAQRELHPAPEEAERDMIKVLRNQGFGAIQGAGGYVTFGQQPYDAVHRTFVYAPKPYELAMRMLAFPNDAELRYPDFVPADVALAATMRWEMQQAFDAFGTLFDEYIGDKGAFADVLDSIKSDPDGPQVDIRQELIAYLGTQATLITDHNLPIAPECQRNLFAAATTDEAAMAKAIERVLKGDPSVAKHEFEGVTLWEIKEEELPADSVGSLAVEGAPPIGQDAGAGDDVAPEEEMQGGLPTSAICVAHGHLMIASHLDYLKKILQGAGKAPNLNQDPLVEQSLQQLADLGVDTRSMRVFIRTEKALRPNYELLRMGKATDAKSPLGRLMKTFGSDPERQPKDKFDGSKLPEFEKIADRLGTHSAAVKSEEDGWTIIGFSRPRGGEDKN